MTESVRFYTHHDDGNDQSSQTNQVELLREEFNQLDVAALGEVRGDAAAEQCSSDILDYNRYNNIK